jgi:PAS domain S-box-containing protein
MKESPASTILIVDDEPAVRQGLGKVLAAEGYTVVPAASGAEALVKAAELIPDLVLLDVEMPGLDGLEVCRRLRADPTLAEVPVIMVTSLANRGSRLQGFEAGADDFMSKPFDEIELLARVRSITRLNRYRQLLQAQEALRESEERYRTLFENALIGIYRTTPDGRVLAANSTLIQMLGYTSFDDLAALNQEQDSFTARQPRRLFEKLVERTGAITGLEYMWVRRDGSVVFVRESARARRGQDGAITYYEGMIEDVTERKQAESALRQSEQKFRNIVEQASDGIVLTDEQGNITEWNQSQEWITGLKKEETIGLPFWDVHSQLIPKDRDGESFRRMLRDSQREFFRTGQAPWLNQPIEYDILRPDGTRRIIQAVAFPVQTENGFIIGSVTRDVTGQIRAQEEIQRRYRELAALNEIGQTITSTLDMRETLMLITSHTNLLMGTQATSVLLYDDERDDLYFAAASGLGADFVLGRRLPLGQGIAGWVVERDEPALVPDVSQDPRWLSDFDKGGSFTTRSLICIPLRSKGHVIGVIEAINKESGFSQDDLHLLNALAAPVSTAIENARLFEQVRRGREQLQALSRRLVEVQETERGSIARELHDETGQALSSLLLNLSLLEQQKNSPKGVKDRIVQMETLVDGMLENLHRLAMNLRPATLDHLGLIPALGQYVETFGEQYGIAAQFETVGFGRDRLAPEVETTLYRIAQEALTNVIRHAQATHVDVLLERRGGVVVAIVEDDGIGFDLEAAKQGGRLGLFGMQERAEMLGGRLVIESAAGAGTTVFVEVPYAYPDPDRR